MTEVNNTIANIIPSNMLASDLYQIGYKYSVYRMNGEYKLTKPIPDKRYRKGFRLEVIASSSDCEDFIKQITDLFKS